jgi:uncharacterized membrane protein (UPF0182 family)
MLLNTLQTLVDTGARMMRGESFTDVNGRNNVLVILIVLVLYIALILFVGMFLYNNVLCKTLTVVRPIPNVWHLLGLVLLLDLLLPNCMCGKMM